MIDQLWKKKFLQKGNKNETSREIRCYYEQEKVQGFDSSEHGSCILHYITKAGYNMNLRSNLDDGDYSQMIDLSSTAQSQNL